MLHVMITQVTVLSQMLQSHITQLHDTKKVIKHSKTNKII